MTSPIGTMTFIGSRESPAQQEVARTSASCDYSPTRAHHWYIEPNAGKTSQGKCLHCKQVKVFYNWFDVMYRNDDIKITGMENY